MSFFYRGSGRKSPIYSRSLMRLLTSVALLAYPIGCVVRVLYTDPDRQAELFVGDMAGLALIILAFIAFIMIAPSNLQRIVGDEKKNLDEFELDLRRRANGFAYQAFASLALIGVFYMSVAVDDNRLSALGLWTPASYEAWNAIMWGGLLYAFTLPTAYLAWFGPSPIMEDEVESA